MISKRDIIWKTCGPYTSRILRLSKRNIAVTTKLFDEDKSSGTTDNEQTDFKANSDQSGDTVDKKEEAARKMRDLLLSMKKSDFDTKTIVDLAKPRIYDRKFHLEEVEKAKRDKEEKEKQSLGYRLKEAAQEVAKTLGGDVEKTEEELLELLVRTKEDEQDVDGLSAKNVVPDEEMNVSESDEKRVNISELIAGMKVDMTSSESSIPLEQTRAYQIKKLLMKKSGKEEELKEFFTSRKPRRYEETQLERIDIFGETPLGIFDDKKFIEQPSDSNSGAVLSTWSNLASRELRLSITQPSANIYEQLILWTEQGKLWRFPIDNEQDWHDEKKVDFTEHVFLEQHLEPWCPTDGPLRHFMELVCVGLSKNPYLTVEEKKEHIFWYENYFRSKRDVFERAEVPPVIEREQVSIEQ